MNTYKKHRGGEGGLKSGKCRRIRRKNSLPSLLGSTGASRNRYKFRWEGHLTPSRKIRYSWGVLDRGAEAISSRAGGSEQLRRPARKGHSQHFPPKFSREADLREDWGARSTPAHCHPFGPDGALSRSEPTRTGHPPGLPSPASSSDVKKPCVVCVCRRGAARRGGRPCERIGSGQKCSPGLQTRGFRSLLKKRCHSEDSRPGRDDEESAVFLDSCEKADSSPASAGSE